MMDILLSTTRPGEPAWILPTGLSDSQSYAFQLVHGFESSFHNVVCLGPLPYRLVLEAWMRMEKKPVPSDYACDLIPGFSRKDLYLLPGLITCHQFLLATMKHVPRREHLLNALQNEHPHDWAKDIIRARRTAHPTRLP